MGLHTFRHVFGHGLKSSWRVWSSAVNGSSAFKIRFKHEIYSRLFHGRGCVCSVSRCGA